MGRKESNQTNKEPIHMCAYIINMVQYFQKIVKVEATGVRVYRELVLADFFFIFFLFDKRVTILADIILTFARIILD